MSYVNSSGSTTLQKMVPCKESPEEVCKSFGVDPTIGLTSRSVNEHMRRFGKNALDSKPPKSLLESIMEQFEDLLVRILLFSALMSFILAILGGSFESDGLTALVEPFVILIILVVNAVIAIMQENDSAKALEELTLLQPVYAKVKRDGLFKDIHAEDVVPGDIIEVRVGDKIPADARIVEILSVALKVEQSGLTGENVAVEKVEEALPPTNEASITDQNNMLFSATTIVAGMCHAVVIATGMRTQIGHIQAAVMDADEEQKKTPLGEKIDEFGEMLANAIAVICVIVWLINWRHFADPEHRGWMSGCIYYFKIAISLAVAAIPEGLPAVITTCLALGTRRMTARNAIVRHLPSVETLGCTTVICSDKTGTLTTNEMVARNVITFDDNGKMDHLEVEGSSFKPYGRVFRNGPEGDSDVPPMGTTDVAMQWVARVCSMNNASSLVVDYSDTETIRYKPKGEPTEAALRVLVEKLGCPDYNVNKSGYRHEDRSTNANLFNNYWSSDWNEILTMEFDRKRKSMSEFVRHKSDGREVLLVKGAPESIMARSNSLMCRNGTTVLIDDASRAEIENQFVQLASRGLRIIMVAIRTDLPSELIGLTTENKRQRARNIEAVLVESNLILLGFVALVDPPRPQVPGAIAKCKEAGIIVHMITGDNQLTAEAIAMEVGIIDDLAFSTTCHSIVGADFGKMTEGEQLDFLSQNHGLVFSRMEPKHKQIVIKRLRELGHVIAMTGDGVNDAPALKNADIGISMGISGSAVAKEASDMILADDNFDTIVAAVEEGRSIYNNMKAFIRYLISSNIGEVASIFLTAAIGVPEGLTPVQLLWVNLVTDGPPATALGFNPPDVDVMQKRPRGKDDPLISNWVFVRYCIVGLYVGFATVAGFMWWYLFDTDSGHSTVTYWELTHWNQCYGWDTYRPIFDGVAHKDPCALFYGGKLTASTMSLSVLVTIEMLNAFNAISEDHSLLSLPPWHNPWLIAAATSSMVMHAAILYIPWLANIFGVVPLGLKEWNVVILLSLPVIFIEELLKWVTRSGLIARLTAEKPLGKML